MEKELAYTLTETGKTVVLELGKLDSTEASVVVKCNEGASFDWEATAGLILFRHEQPDNSGVTKETDCDDYMFFLNSESRRAASMYRDDIAGCRRREQE